MPRRTRSQGRPGTSVVPDIWETSHAVPVGKTMTAQCVIYPPQSSDTEPVMGADLAYAPSTAAVPLYTGACRVQALKAQDNATLVGGQDQRTVGYLVAIDRDAADIPVKAVVKFTTISDPSLLSPRRLIVSVNTRGSLRFERDLFCVDDLTSGPTS